jgi:hypothetical protein
VWGFADAFPYAPTLKGYNAKQGQGLDYVIAGAGRRGLRVEIALANFWPGQQRVLGLAFIIALPQHLCMKLQ